MNEPINPFDPVHQPDPWPMYRRLQVEAPVLQLPDGGWFLSRFEHCAPMLRDPRFGSDPARLAERHRPEGNRSVAYDPESKAILFMDPPEHTRLRRLVAAAFTPRAIGAWRTRIETIADGLLDGLAEGQRSDLIAAYADPLPVDAITAILGVSNADQQPFRVWSSAASRMLDGNLDDATFAAGLHATAELYGYFASVIEHRRARIAASEPDLIDHLIAAGDADDQLGAEELLVLIVTLFVAGHETTAGLIANTVHHLLHERHLWEELVRGPRRVDPPLVNEALRLFGPAQVASRIALVDVDLDGHRVEAGDPVVVGLAAANRDPRRWVEPDRFDFERDASAHLAFSAGPHHCLGASLARLELEIALNRLIARFPTLALDQSAGDPPRRPHVVLRSLEELSVIVGVRA